MIKISSFSGCFSTFSLQVFRSFSLLKWLSLAGKAHQTEWPSASAVAVGSLLSPRDFFLKVFHDFSFVLLKGRTIATFLIGLSGSHFRRRKILSFGVGLAHSGSWLWVFHWGFLFISDKNFISENPKTLFVEFGGPGSISVEVVLDLGSRFYCANFWMRFSSFFFTGKKKWESIWWKTAMFD